MMYRQQVIVSWMYRHHVFFKFKILNQPDLWGGLPAVSHNFRLTDQNRE